LRVSSRFKVFLIALKTKEGKTYAEPSQAD
jgi:hypothetical protein